jgi:multiple sugar transport system permease protein
MSWVGAGNYLSLLDDESFYTSLKNNVIWLLLYLLAIPAGLGIALFLNQTVAGIRIYKSLFFFPFVISQVVVGLIFSWFYAPDFGLLPKIIGFFSGTETAILADDRFATYGIIAAGLWPQIAYCMILYLTGLNNINPEQVEAARMDNARGWSMLWNIIIPQLRPATFIAMVVTIIGALRSFDLISIMTSGGPYGSTRVLSYFMYEQSLSEYGYAMGYGAAIAVVLFAIMLVFITLFIVRMLGQERNA